ncbi:MAG: hypothetical protein P4K92_00615 [Candidatus Nitrosotalea sp.]|nr:hypothetical protein [Candidatus Nitrosotalea sp.]
MGSLEAENKIAFITCIEIVLMRRGNVNYNLVLAKLKAQFSCGMDDCLDHPEYLKTVLKEVYKHDYNAVLDDISLETDKLTDIDKIKADFFKFMMS